MTGDGMPCGMTKIFPVYSGHDADVLYALMEPDWDVKALYNMKPETSMKRCIAIALFLAACASGLHAQQRGYQDQRTIARAKVVKVERSNPNPGNPAMAEVRVRLQVLDGEHRGEEKVALYRGEDELPSEMFYREGNTVFIGIGLSESADSVEYISIYDVDNTTSLIVIFIVVVLSVLAIARWRGVLSLVALVATIFLVFYVLIPMTLRGYSPLPLAIVISIVSIGLTVPIIMGLELKTAAAILGAVGGVVMASVLSILTSWILHLSGIVTNEMVTVFYASSVNINLRDLALAGMIIAALGAIMDVCISISSAGAELFRVHPSIPTGEAFRSIFTVSNDILGSTLNTLLLAYVGSSLPMVLLIAMRMGPDTPFWLVLNYNPVLSEIVKSAVGCLGMFLSMPITAWICITLYRKKARAAGHTGE